ncbi:MAG: hypothetical protein LC437_03415 [Thiohalomonas sp.]|nr:hypothetical protein [Thiohalomonas sp.]
MFTVITWCTSGYKYLAEGLISDCKRLGYDYHIYELDKEFPNLAAAYCNHPRIVRQGVETFNKILFLDVECRIVKPIPEHWEAPLVSVREPAQNFWITYNTGTVMADRSCIPWLDMWVLLVDAWGMDNLSSDAYIYWPNDIGDELPFNAAITAMNIQLNTVKLSYIDRTGKAELARGLWKNEHTVIQHPTIHHWPKEEGLVECKKLFVQNFAGDPEVAKTLFNTSKNIVENNGWIFDAVEKYYAPKEFWPDNKRKWISEPVILSSAQR